MTDLEVSLMAGVIRARDCGFRATASALEGVFFAIRKNAAATDEEEMAISEAENDTPVVVFG